MIELVVRTTSESVCFLQLQKTRNIRQLNMSSSSTIIDSESTLVPLSEATRFIKDCLMAVGAPDKHAEAQAILLSNADYVGHYSHGMNRLEMYVEEIQAGRCDPKAEPKILKQSPATAWVDGQNGLGAIIGNFSMDLAIEKAKKVGVGWVVAKNSNHYGMAQHYTLRAAKEGLLGFSCTNTSPLMTPTRAKQPGLGTNPISLAAPAKNNDRFLLDMATTAVALGKLEMKKRKGEPLPPGWATDSEGEVTTDVDIAYAANSLMPLGGGEETSGYKGYGLSLMVDLLGGVLAGCDRSRAVLECCWNRPIVIDQYVCRRFKDKRIIGATTGANVRRWGDFEQDANLGQCFYAVDPNCFAPGFEDRLGDLLNNFRRMTPIDENKPVLVAGDPEVQHMKQVDQLGGVKFVKNQMETCMKLAKLLNVQSLQSIV